jgi:hypothetical protein
MVAVKWKLRLKAQTLSEKSPEQFGALPSRRQLVASAVRVIYGQNRTTKAGETFFAMATGYTNSSLRCDLDHSEFCCFCYATSAEQFIRFSADGRTAWL